MSQESESFFIKEFEISSKLGKDCMIKIVANQNYSKVFSLDYRNGNIKVFDLETGEQLKNFSDYPYSSSNTATFPVFVTSDESKIVCRDGGEYIFVIDLQTGNTLHTYCDSEGFHSLTFKVTSDNQKIIYCSYRNTIKICELETGKELLNIPSGHYYLDHLAITSDNQKIISFGEDSIVEIDNNNLEKIANFSIRIWDINTGNKLREIRFPMDRDYFVPDFIITPDSNKIIYSQELHGSPDSYEIVILDLETETILYCQYDDFLDSIVIIPNSNQFISCHYNGNVKFWDIETGKNLYNFSPSNNCNSVEITSDCNQLISYACGHHVAEKSIKLWDLNSILKIINNDKNNIYSQHSAHFKTILG